MVEEGGNVFGPKKARKKVISVLTFPVEMWLLSCS